MQIQRTRLLTAALLALVVAPLGACVPAEWRYSFVVIADPHIAGSADHDARLQDAIHWVNANREAEKIELVLLLGDIAWGTGEVTRTRAMLDALEVPYVPVIGDNELHNGDESQVAAEWATHYTRLASELSGFSMAPTPVWNPEFGKLSYFVNFAFQHKGVSFVAMDWVSRLMDVILGEQAELHDFEGGTWPWFVEAMRAAPSDRLENIVMLSHHPMHLQSLGAFDSTELARVEGETALRGDRVYANFAGHYHFSFQHSDPVGQYDVYITDATWDDDNVVRVVRVKDDGTTMSYEHREVIVPIGG